jgi:hypothetical protein
MASKKAPRGVYLHVKNLHFTKDKLGVRVSARVGKLPAADLKRLIAFFEHLR